MDFKTGMVVTGLPESDRVYSITNTKMLKGLVTDVNGENITVKTIEHLNGCTGEHVVAAKHFRPVDCETTVVRTQDDYDALPVDYPGVIEFSNGENWIFIKEQKGYAIVVKDKSYIKAGNATVEAWGNATVEASGNATVRASDNATVRASDNATVRAWGNATVRASGNATVEASDNATVWAWGNATVEASDNATVEASGNATVEASGNATVRAWGNVQILNLSCRGALQTFANARIVFMPHDLPEFLAFHGIEVLDGKVRMYKAVHGDDLHSQYDSRFKYGVGKTIIHDCDQNQNEDCGRGLHISTLNWALDFGRDWDDLRIIECEVPVDKIVFSFGSTGKVRTSELTVLRVVPLDECGVFGKILAKKQTKKA